MGPAAVSSRVTLPDQGKFNAAQKMNFMMVMSTWPLFIVTGLTVWLADVPILAWLAHFSLALIAAPLIGGHIYMATINPATRKGLKGMFTGLVDREWAKHHHRRWYLENFEKEERGIQRPRNSDDPLEQPARLRCAACRTEHLLGSWSSLLRSVFEPGPMFCPNCSAELTTIIPVVTDPELMNLILQRLERSGGEDALEELPLFPSAEVTNPATPPRAARARDSAA